MFTPKEEQRWVYFGTLGDGNHTVMQCREAIRWLADCIPDCWRRDITDDIRPAMDYLAHHVREAHVKRLWQALDNPDPVQRVHMAKAALRTLARALPGYRGK